MMKKLNQTISTLIIALAMVITAQNVAAKELSDQAKKATEWVASLELNDKKTEKQVVKVVTEHLTAVKTWHDEHPFETVPAGINPRTGDKLTDLDRQMIADSAMPKSVHENLMTGLRAVLSEEQVEAILDRYTVGKVAFTFKAYKEIVPNMSSEDEAYILDNLKKAREIAVDYKSMKQISAIFEIYKTKNEQYFTNSGRSWHKMYGDYVRSLKAKKK